MNTITVKPMQGHRKSALPGQPAKLQDEVCRGARTQEEFCKRLWELQGRVGLLVQKPFHDLKCVRDTQQRVGRNRSCRKWLPRRLYTHSCVSAYFSNTGGKRFYYHCTCHTDTREKGQLTGFQRRQCRNEHLWQSANFSD